MCASLFKTSWLITVLAISTRNSVGKFMENTCTQQNCYSQVHDKEYYSLVKLEGKQQRGLDSCFGLLFFSSFFLGNRRQISRWYVSQQYINWSYRIGLTLPKIIAHCESETYFNYLCSPEIFHLLSHLISHQGRDSGRLFHQPSGSSFPLATCGTPVRSHLYGNSQTLAGLLCTALLQRSNEWPAKIWDVVCCSDLKSGMLSSSSCGCSDALTWPMPSWWPGQAGHFLGDADSCASWVMGSWEMMTQGTLDLLCNTRPSVIQIRTHLLLKWYNFLQYLVYIVSL